MKQSRAGAPEFIRAHPYQPAPLWVWVVTILLAGLGAALFLLLAFAG